MLTLRQSPFDLFERLEQQLATAERVPNAEIRETETGYTCDLNCPGWTATRSTSRPPIATW